MALFDKFRKKQKEKEAQKREGVEKPKTEPKKQEAKPVAKEALPAGKQATWIYRIIKEPHITEKATDLSENNKYVFNVYPRANKTEIKRAVKALYNVSVKSVNIIHSPAKGRRLGRISGWRHGLKKGFKKAIVTIGKGEKIDIMPR